jgi:hypothetical protein
MADLEVTPEYLSKLATTHDAAASTAESAANAAASLTSDVWVSHGVASGASNVAFAKAEFARRGAGEAMKGSSTDLSAKLRAADDAYAGTDEQAGDNLDNQVLDR